MKFARTSVFCATGTSGAASWKQKPVGLCRAALFVLASLTTGCGSDDGASDATTDDTQGPGATVAPDGTTPNSSANPDASGTTGTPMNDGQGGSTADSPPLDVGDEDGGSGPTPDATPGTGGAGDGDDDPTGGNGAMAGASPGGGGNASGCTITPTAEISEAIQTVGIVTFSTDVASVDEARIEFGLDDSYGMTAPVDLAEPAYRTLLLGMKQDREYHYRIFVSSNGVECASEDLTITTGLLPNILPQLEVMTYEPEQLAGGFLMTGQYQAMGGDSSPAYIIDQDGDFVWAIAVGDYVTGVRMSYDGKYMWINGTDNSGAGVANIHRVSMDGLIDEDLSEQFGQQDHSITVLPDETVVFYGHDQFECANIRQRFPDGRVELIMNARDAHGAPGQCHVNAIEYSPEDDTLVFSDDLHNNYTKITRDGQVVWVLGGPTSQFTGEGASWSRQHGIDILSLDRVLMFNNGEMQAPEGSRAIELLLDLDEMTATPTWIYQPDPPISNQVLGDVQRMDNGNTVVAFSAQGLVHELDAEGNLLQEISWPLGGAFGYIVKRQTLYGPPPR